MIQHATRLCLAAAAACLWALPASAAEPAGFRWKDNPELAATDLLYGDQPVLRYMHAYDPSTPESLHDTYKVYHHVFGPGTGTRITKGPGGQFTHHRGLFAAWNKTQADGKSFDFWHCTNGAHQRHVEFIEKKAGENGATMTAEIHWNDAEGKPVIVEQRTVTVEKLPVESAPGYGWKIDWRSRLESRRGEIRLTGDRQHAGFQFRADQPVAEQNSARYIRPEGAPQQPEAVQVDDRKDPEGHINLNWFAMTYPLGDERYTVEYFEDPTLPKPSRYSERPYGRFGAFFETTLVPDEPLVMNYRVIVTTGEPPSRETIQKRYDEFVKELEE